MLTSSDLKELGIKPGPVFGRILSEAKNCGTREEAIELAQNIWGESQQQKKPQKERVQMIPGSVWHWLCTNITFQGMFSREMEGKIASNSEKRRWLLNGAVLLNGEYPGPDDPMPTVAEFKIIDDEATTRLLTVKDNSAFAIKKLRVHYEITQLVFFPNSRSKCTMG